MRDIAVVGMACRFPGGLDDLDLLLAALRQRTVTAGPIPVSSWSRRRWCGWKFDTPMERARPSR